MDPQAEDWIKVASLVKQPWVDDVPEHTGSIAERSAAATPSLSRPTSAALSVLGEAGSARKAISLRSEMIEQRRAIGAVATSNQQQQPSSVMEIALDNMLLTDLGDCGGTIPSPIAGYPNLRRLTLNFNKLEALVPQTTLASLTDLREFEADHNKIPTLGPLSNPRLETVSMSHNRIETLTSLALPKLHTLDLNHNLLGKAFLSNPDGINDLRLPNLTHIDVSHNKLLNLEWVQGLTRLLHLNVSHNQLSSLNGIQNCLALEEINASYNRLRYVPTLQHNNALRSVGKSLQVLDVSHNDISSLGFFPPAGCLSKVWSLSIASNAFHGKKQVDEEGNALALGGKRRTSNSSSVLRGAGKTSTKGIFNSDDIGDGMYDGESAPSSTPRRASLRSGGAQGAQSQFGASSQRPALNSRGTSGAEGEAAITFLARLAQLFPAVEMLDLSHNSEEILADVADLAFLKKCPQLTEIRIEGTLTMPKSNKDRVTEAVRSCLPQIEVINGEVVVQREPVAAVNVEDLESLAIATNSGLFSVSKLMSSKAGSAAQRPPSAGALIRPGTSSQAKNGAIQASKVREDLDAFTQEMERFFLRAEVSRRKCDAIIDHLNANAAWAYGDGAQPDAIDEIELEKKLEAELTGTSFAKKLVDGDSDEDDGAETLDLTEQPGLDVPASTTASVSNTPRQPAAPPRGRPSALATATAASPKKKKQQDDVESNNCSNRSRSAISSASGSHLAQTPTSTSSGGRGGQRSSSVRSNGPASVLYEESEAMKRIKSQPGSSFRLEQAKFREQMEAEAKLRRSQIEALTKERPLPAPKAKKGWAPQSPVALLNDSLLAAASSKAQHAKKEFGTSMVSPSKEEMVRSSSAASGAAAVRISASTATSPQKSALVSVATTTPPPSPPPSSQAPRVAPQVQGAAITTASPTTQAPHCAKVPTTVPMLNLSKTQAPPSLDDEEDLAMMPTTSEIARETVASEVVSDPRKASRKPLESPDLPNGNSPVDEMLGTLSGPPALASTRGVVTVDLLGTQGSRPSSSLSSSRQQPKVRMGKPSADVNPLVKANLILTNKQQAPAPVERTFQKEPDEGKEEEETSYFSTAPVAISLVSKTPQVGGTSLNSRRRK